MASEVCTGETAESLDGVASNCPQQATDAAEKPDDLQGIMNLSLFHTPPPPPTTPSKLFMFSSI